MREQTIAYGGRLTVDGGNNGGVSIKGWDNASVLVRSKVKLHGRRTMRRLKSSVANSRQLVGWDK